MISEQFLWVERYRPHKVQDCILPDSLKKTFQDYVDTKTIPNLLLGGGPGMGKTTIAKAMCDELELDYIMINGSNEGRLIENLRNKVIGFASSVSLNGGRKVIIVDEADNLGKDAMLAFRAVIEEFADHCSFIFTCNKPSRIIEAIHSRCAVIQFQIASDERSKLAGLFFKRIVGILTEQKVEFDRQTVVDLVKRYFPDFRRCLNELQRYSTSGKIDSGIFQLLANNYDSLIADLRAKEFNKVQSWVGENVDLNSTEVITEVYLRIKDIVKKEFVPAAIVMLGDYQHKAALAADPALNLMAMFSHMMLELEMKDA